MVDPPKPPPRPAQTQLPLPLAPLPERDAVFLESPSNTEALQLLARPDTWPNHRLALFGPEGSGKTLLATTTFGTAAHWLPPLALPPPGLLPPGPLVIDRADTCPDPELLLHWVNAAAAAHAQLLLIGRDPPSRWPAKLPDLASRLRATLAIGIGQPDDPLLRALLARHLAARQLHVPPPVQDWLVTRLPRTAAIMQRVAEALDAASLARQHPITKGFARDALAGFLAGHDHEA